MALAPSPSPPARPGSPPGKGSTAELAGKLAVSQPGVGVSMGQTVAAVASSPQSSNPADLTGASPDCLDIALRSQDTKGFSSPPLSPFSDLHVVLQTSSA